MKRTQIAKFVLLVFTLVAVLSGCGGTKTETPPKSEAPTGSAAKAADPAKAPSSDLKPLDKPVQMKIASLSVGSSWYVYAATMAEVFRTSLPAGSMIDVLPFAGGVGNATLVQNGEADMGLTFSVNGKWALEGTVAYDKKLPDLVALAGGFDQYYVGIVTTKKSGITSIKEIKEKKLPVRLMTVQVGSQGEFATRQVLEAYGLSYDEIKKQGGSVTHTSFDVVQTSMTEGKADMFIQVITAGHPAVSEMAVTTDLHFVSLDPEPVAQLGKVGNNPATIPANTFKGQDYPVNTVGFTTVAFVKNSMPENLAYALTKALAENKPALEQGHKALKIFNPEKAGAPENVGMPLHPGAVRYYKEKGWMK